MFLTKILVFKHILHMMSTSKSSHFEINYHAKTEMQAIPFPQNS